MRFHSTLRLTVACGLISVVAIQAQAIPGKGGHKSGKASDPLDAAIKDLKAAEKELGSKEG